MIAKNTDRPGEGNDLIIQPPQINGELENSKKH
jgi:hypothetical protein